jgi:hypothetical protein
MENTNLPKITISVDEDNKLPDNKLWTNRFEIHSETSDRVYVIAQNKEHGHMGCSCPAWRRYRHCKHLTELGLPGHEVPVNLNLK